MHWVCDVCGEWHRSKKDAESCEERPPEKYKVDKCQYPPKRANDEWEVGDLVLVGIHDRGKHLGIIRDTELIRHVIHPVVDLLGYSKGRIRGGDLNNWGFEHVEVLGEYQEDKILRWAKVIRRRQAGKKV